MTLFPGLSGLLSSHIVISQFETEVLSHFERRECSRGHLLMDLRGACPNPSASRVVGKVGLAERTLEQLA